MRKLQLLLAAALSLSLHAQAAKLTPASKATTSNAMDELDPYAVDIQQQLQQIDADYFKSTGKSPFINNDFLNFRLNSCYKNSCAVWIDVDKSIQRANVYINVFLAYADWKTSSGTPGHGTPNFDKHPDGRVYDRYTSTKYPGGDYNGLGNMPYAVFIYGGFAIHGTGRGNWPKLGRPASHGCIRIHPDNAFIFNRLVRQYGVNNTWITVR